MNFQYKTVEFNGDKAHEEELNRWGAEGWDLICVQTLPPRDSTIYPAFVRTYAYFKRATF